MQSKVAKYTNKIIGKEGTEQFRMFFLKDGVPVSPFHDIPLWVDEKKGIVNMISEIPRGTNAKMEVSTSEKMNPIKQDTKKGKLRFVHDKYPFNYGALSQTWEDPNEIHHETKAKGDNDPLDACEIGSVVAERGAVRQVKVLGTWAMIDDGETDWKILVIDVNDPKADKINTIEDLEEHFPGVAKETFTFLRDYKIPSGNPPNKFAYDNKLLDKEFAMNVVRETNEQWRKMIDAVDSSNFKVERSNTTLHKHNIGAEEANKVLGN